MPAVIAHFLDFLFAARQRRLRFPRKQTGISVALHAPKPELFFEDADLSEEETLETGNAWFFFAKALDQYAEREIDVLDTTLDLPKGALPAPAPVTFESSAPVPEKIKGGA
jgi:hypothetical protein